MSMESRNLDQQLFAHNCDARIETSVTIKEIAERLNTKYGSYYREGLGYWNALSAAWEGYGEILIASPNAVADAGCSIWYSSNKKMNHNIVASMILSVAGDLDALFIDATSGKPVLPIPDLVPTFKQLA